LLILGSRFSSESVSSRVDMYGVDNLQLSTSKPGKRPYEEL